MEIWNRYGHRNGYSRGKNLAYREVVQIGTSKMSI
jgi:hypothetical protein